MTTLPIRIAVRVDFSDGSQHEYEVRGPDAVEPLRGTQFWPEGVVTTDVRKRMEYDRQRQEIIRRLRQALWDVYIACGEDTHGDAEAPPPGVWTPDIDTLALSAVKLLRQERDSAGAITDAAIGAAYEVMQDSAHLTGWDLTRAMLDAAGKAT